MQDLPILLSTKRPLMCYDFIMYKTMLYLALVAIGVTVELLVARMHFTVQKKHLKKNHLPLARYAFLFLFPLLDIFLILSLHGMSIFKIFIICAIVGPIIEWIVGYTYFKTHKKRLWTYNFLSIKGHTSLITMPMFGGIGVLFYSLAEALHFT